MFEDDPTTARKLRPSFQLALVGSKNSTKSFINTFTTNLRCIAAHEGIHVITVAPGFVKTRMMDKMCTSDMADVIVDAVENGGLGDW